MATLQRIAGMGLTSTDAAFDLERLRERIGSIVTHIERTNEKILHSQDVTLVRGTARLADAHTVVADTVAGQEVFEADAILLSTAAVRGRPPGRLDADRILSTRDAYPPKVLRRTS